MRKFSKFLEISKKSTPKAPPGPDAYKTNEIIGILGGNFRPELNFPLNSGNFKNFAEFC